MEQVDLERLVLPALLALLILGAFVIFATSGGGNEATAPTAPAATAAPAATSVPARQDTTPRRRFVKVEPGDTASSIAAAAAISESRLGDLNPSIDLDALRPGQTLKLAP